MPEEHQPSKHDISIKFLCTMDGALGRLEALCCKIAGEEAEDQVSVGLDNMSLSIFLDRLPGIIDQYTDRINRATERIDRLLFCREHAGEMTPEPMTRKYFRDETKKSYSA